MYRKYTVSVVVYTVKPNIYFRVSVLVSVSVSKSGIGISLVLVLYWSAGRANRITAAIISRPQNGV